MIAVIFEVWPKPEHKKEYLDLAAELRPILETIDGFISIERFDTIFDDYRLRIAGVIRDYGMTDRAQAPKDSQAVHAAH